MAIRWTDATPALRLPSLPEHPSPPDPSIAGAEDAAAVDVWIAPAVDRQVMDHLLKQDVEQGGLLVGQAFSGAGSDAVAHVRVTRCAAAEDAEGTAFSLRMGTAVWAAAQALVEPGELIVGWYHSHPGLTAFFSDTDRQTQRAFFNHPYSIGWVIDPCNREEALFLGGDCRVVRRGPDRLPPA